MNKCRHFFLKKIDKVSGKNGCFVEKVGLYQGKYLEVFFVEWKKKYKFGVFHLDFFLLCAELTDVLLLVDAKFGQNWR